jgi:hypothetical protein
MIINKLLGSKQAYKLQKTILSETFPWFWGSPSITSKAPKDQLFQFVHQFLEDNIILSKHYNLINSVIYELTQKTNIKIISIQRVKANLIPRVITCNE